MKRAAVKTERETKKAYLVVDSAGRKGWLQKRWLAADSTVAAATFEKAVENYNERQAAETEAKAWQEASHELRPCRETEKAVAVEALFYGCNSEHLFNRLLWFPKSLLLDGNKAPGWLIAKKIEPEVEDLRERIHDDYMLDRAGIADCDGRFWINGRV